MVNKKLLILIFVGMIFLIIISGFVNSTTKDVKIDWNGYPFEWCSDVDDHNVEFCGYGYGNVQYSCNENGDCSGGFCSGVSKAINQDYYAVVYSNYWYSAKCKDSGHNVGDHFANEIGQSDGNQVYHISTPPQGAIATCSDNDGDGYYSSIFSYGTNLGVDIVCGNSETTMCDTNNPSVHAVTTEIADGLDNDCNGIVDDGFVCINGQTQQCGTTNIGECQIGTKTCTNGQWESCIEYVGPITESCNTKDDNCDGNVDEGGVCPCIDIDGDKYTKSPFGCQTSYISNFQGHGDCDDTKNKIYPEAPELCDLIDNQCVSNYGFGQIDETPDKICSQEKICWSGICKTPTFYWAENSDGTGIITPPSSKSLLSFQKAYLVIENFPREAALWRFEIYEEDGNTDDKIRVEPDWLIPTIQGNKLIAEWNINSGDINSAQSGDADKIYDFYFIAKGFKKNGGNLSGGLNGSWERTAFGQSGAGTWKGTLNHFPASGTWNITGLEGTWEGTRLGSPESGTWDVDYVNFGPSKGDWKSNDETILGTWITTTLEDESVYEFQSLNLILEEELQTPATETCLDEIKNQDETGIDCGGSICSACEVSTTPVDCSQYNLCSQITNSPDCNSCSVVSTLDGCLWNSGVCNTFEDLLDTSGNPIGKCEYTEDATDNCDDGVLDYSLILTTDSHADCLPKDSQSIFCSAQTSLPLENKFGILLTIISIIGIYFVFFRKKKKW